MPPCIGPDRLQVEPMSARASSDCDEIYQTRKSAAMAPLLPKTPGFRRRPPTLKEVITLGSGVCLCSLNVAIRPRARPRWPPPAAVREAYPAINRQRAIRLGGL